MKLTSNQIKDNQPIPVSNAFGTHDATTHVALADNRNPDLSWDDVPEGTRSFVLICHDPDVPSKPDDVNQEDREVPADLPRVDFYHWVLVDIPADQRQIAAGADSDGITPKGKPGGASPAGGIRGINNYTDWFAGDADMAGDYYGYDGPCPPWNDSILHRYCFTLYALDIESCGLSGRFGGPEALAAIEGHVLESASITGTYAINPRVA
ncbi:YbhB/YbcL family Raf kinase inhibitor-like protein [Sedimenticola thiotaurini]|uniref:Phospholipid-binding protein n=1 Tax=Sedimenticola thiotaurini TaxID=1543721 RepID=A0A0F7K2Q1_9GAMM|nr:YbhB/YbcL family Raf kinase inhibitor-like protein [Sedimenticola thiotaurini]AKH22082.1 phospholipid-binding protein [Sedimenticola thiotaurini]